MPEYKREEAAVFFSAKEEFFPLSNIAGEMRLKWKHVICSSSESLYQASKYHPDVVCVPVDTSGKTTEPHVQKRVLDSKNAMGSKMTQKCAVKSGFVRHDWDEIKIDVMRWVLELKLQQHPEKFGKVLKSTGTKPIVEKSRKDSFWGAIEGPDGILRGENHLGRLLTALRDKNFDRVGAGELTHPEGFLIVKQTVEEEED